MIDETYYELLYPLLYVFYQQQIIWRIYDNFSIALVPHLNSNPAAEQFPK